MSSVMPLRKNRKTQLSYTQLNINLSKINGYRTVVFNPNNGSSYSGQWKNTEKSGFGIKYQANSLVYDGQWKNDNRQGQGCVKKMLPNGYALRIYIGKWLNDQKHGEGKKFYNNGIYYGMWENDSRCGFGIMWYNNGAIYLGEWNNNKYNGTGVIFQSNGNRYEGYFLNGKKHGEGLFFHMKTGQIQKGIWEENVCKTSMMFDDFRNQVKMPTEYPIQQNKILNPDILIYDLFRRYLPKYEVSVDNLKGLSCLELVKKINKYIYHLFKNFYPNKL